MPKLANKFAALWFLISLLAATGAGGLAMADPLRFSGVIDLLATIISILVGVSLAVIAVLVSPFSVSNANTKDEEEAERMTRLVEIDDINLAAGQLFLFGLHMLSLLLALAFRWLFDPMMQPVDETISKLAAVTAFTGILAFFWSARLPMLLIAVSRQRRTLG